MVDWRRLVIRALSWITYAVHGAVMATARALGPAKVSKARILREVGLFRVQEMEEMQTEIGHMIQDRNLREAEKQQQREEKQTEQTFFVQREKRQNEHRNRQPSSASESSWSKVSEPPGKTMPKTVFSSNPRIAKPERWSPIWRPNRRLIRAGRFYATAPPAVSTTATT